MLMKLSWLDFAVIIAYFVAVLGVGYWLKGKIKTSSDFLLSKRSFSALDHGYCVYVRKPGRLEVIGHTANGAEYGIEPTTGIGSAPFRPWFFWACSWCATITRTACAAFRIPAYAGPYDTIALTSSMPSASPLSRC